MYQLLSFIAEEKKIKGNFMHRKQDTLGALLKYNTNKKYSL